MGGLVFRKLEDSSLRANELLNVQTIKESKLTFDSLSPCICSERSATGELVSCIDSGTPPVQETIQTWAAFSSSKTWQSI